MTRILVYGDSNTWGFLPVDPMLGIIERLAFEHRWTGVAQALLGEDWDIVEDALPGRTLGVDRPDMAVGADLGAGVWNGSTELLAALVRNVPVDVVVIALGTNDLLVEPDIMVDAYLARVAALVTRIQTFKLPLPLKGMERPAKVMVLSPPAMRSSHSNPNADHAEATRILVTHAHQQHADAFGYTLINAARVITSLEGDGVHLDIHAHQRLGALVASVLADAQFGEG